MGINLDESNCVVYLVACQAQSTIYVKIGRSRNLRRRLSNIQTGCPHQITDVFVIASEFEEEVDGLERLLRLLLKEDRLRGEWYQGSDRFFGNLDHILVRINAGGFSYDEIYEVSETGHGSELEIMLHKHDFSFKRLPLSPRRVLQFSNELVDISPSEIAKALFREES